jgi:fatty acid desaturase
MDLKTYQSIQSQLNFARRTSMWVRHGLIDLLLLGASLWLLTKASWVPYLAAQAILAVVFFRGFSLMHEAVHQSVSNNPWINTVVGLYGAVLCFMPYHSWKYLHLEHHQWAGNIDRDPSNKLRKDYDPSKRLKYRLLTGIWRSWIPLLGLMQEGVFWVYPFKQLKKPDLPSGD